MKRLLIIAVLMNIGFSGQWALGQADRLQVRPVQEGQLNEPVKITGTVVEIKKYSFVLNVDGQDYQVRLAKGGELKLRLDKPFFNLEKNVVIVSNAGAKKPEDRSTYKLGPVNYIRASFIHDRQKNRIMAAKVKRLNNYEISPKPFELIEPSEGQTQPPSLSGQLVKKIGKPDWVLRNKDTEEFEIKLGYQNAKLMGFTIHDLVPNSTLVEVNGKRNGESIEASTVEFWPKSTGGEPTK